MKKLLTVFVATSICSASFAQVSVGVQGTANFSKPKTSTEAVMGATQSGSILPGLGVVADFAFAKNLSVRADISYLQHGFKVKGILSGDLPDGASSATIDGKTVLNYVQIPVNVVYRFPTAKHQLYIGAGAYFSYGISGKVRLTVKLDDQQVEGGTMEEDPFKSGAANEGLKRSDIGVNGLAGIKFSNGVFVNLGYQLGLSNNSRDKYSEFKNRGLQLSLGYFFWNR